MNFYTERLAYQMNVSITGEMKHRLLMMSKKYNVTISELIRDMIGKELDELEQKED